MIYLVTKKKLLEGEAIAVLTDTIKVMLLSQAYVPNLAEDEFLSDIVAHEVEMDGYDAGGKELQNKTLTLDTLTGIVKFDADDISWDITGTGSAHKAVIYKDTGDPETSPLLMLKSFLQLRTVTNQSFRIEWSAEGILTLP